jgi:hypothetical protein
MHADDRLPSEGITLAMFPHRQVQFALLAQQFFVPKVKNFIVSDFFSKKIYRSFACDERCASMPDSPSSLSCTVKCSTALYRP